MCVCVPYGWMVNHFMHTHTYVRNFARLYSAYNNKMIIIICTEIEINRQFTNALHCIIQVLCSIFKLIFLRLNDRFSIFSHENSLFSSAPLLSFECHSHSLSLALLSIIPLLRTNIICNMHCI